MGGGMSPLLTMRPAGAGAFSCSDLAACSLANLGTRDHHLATGLLDDDHTQYALLLGRSGGQTLYGGTAYGHQLGLASRRGAASGILALQEASPQLALTGGLDVSGHIAAGSLASINATRALNVEASLAGTQAIALYGKVIGAQAAGSAITMGVAGGATAQGTPALAFAYGLYFFAAHNTPSGCYSVTPIYLSMQSGASGSGALQFATGLLITGAVWNGSKPGTATGVDVLNQGAAAVTTAYAFRARDQIGTTVRLLELGPTTPYLRVLGGGDPAANQSNLYLKMGATLKQVSEGAAHSGGTGYRVLRAPN